MELYIKDGTGNGIAAEVNTDHQLVTQATTGTLVHHASKKHTNAYSTYMTDSDFIQLGTTGGPLMFIQNNSDDIMLIERFIATCTGGTMNWIYRNMDLGTIGNNTERTGHNLNFNSQKQPAATIYGWNASGDSMTGLSGGTKIAPMYVPAGAVVDVNFPGSWILQKGNNIVFSSKAISSACYYQLMILFYFLPSTI